tara:strand:- start:10277 stop:10543 length:267 start_codon:yes stop_codon:yes gene_type:complete
MSFIEKDNLNYLTTVEHFFLGLKGSGLALSAADYHLINEWEKRGIPLEVLCQAIERGFKHHRENFHASRISLSYFKKIIDKEIEKTEK